MQTGHPTSATDIEVIATDSPKLPGGLTDFGSNLLEVLPGAVQLWAPVTPASGEEQSPTDFVLQYCNPDAVALLGLQPGTLLSRLPYVLRAVGTADKPPIDAFFAAVLSERTEAIGVYRQSANAAFYRLACKPFGDAVLVLAVDITNQMAVKPDGTMPAAKGWGKDQTPEHLANRLQAIIGSSHSGVSTFIPVFNDNGEIVDFRFNLVNQMVATYIGQTAEVLSGSLASVYFPAYMANGLFEIYRDCFLTGERRQFDFHYDDGYDVFFNLLVMKLDNELLITLTDQTNLKRLQRDLEASIAELKRSNASLEQFAHAASHDLQEPLRRISIYSEKLLQEYGQVLDDTGYGYLERIRTAGRRMLRLVQDLLVFAEVGARKNSFEELDLNELLGEVMADLEVSIAERDAVIEVGKLGKLRGDAVHLQQLFQNMISNGLKYSRHGVPPYIRISATTVQGRQLELDMTPAQQQQHYLQLEFKDNGQGFTKEDATQIFKIFQRLPQHRTEYSGTGIGLAIVQRVVENHRGFITAEGVPDEGATFRVLLPLNGIGS